MILERTLLLKQAVLAIAKTGTDCAALLFEWRL
jgi:hypothetical protein